MEDSELAPGSTASAEDIEGFEPPRGGLDGYPIDSLAIRTEQRSVFDVVRRVDQKLLVLDPDFQRDFVWPKDKQSKLIESTLLRIPLPVFYLAEEESGKVVVVDGLQRLTTLWTFLKDKLRLQNLSESHSSLEGKKFSELGPKLRSRIEDTPLILYLIDPKVPDRAKLDIFDRVNSGVPLTRQQMRNCLYSGVGTRLLKDLAQETEFKEATGASFKSDTMRDREAINRFLSFHLLGVDRYKGYMDDFLAEGLKLLQGSNGEEIATRLTEDFLRSMKVNREVFGAHAFRKSSGDGARRSSINMSLFDIFSVAFGREGSERFLNQQNKVQKMLSDLLNEEDFKMSVTYGTNDVKRVATRFKMLTESLQSLGV